MHILQINSDYEYGSTGRIVKELQEKIRLKGDECTVAYGRERIKGIAKARVIHIGQSFDNYVHLAKTRVFDAHGFSSFFATKRFIETIGKIRPDVVHLHNLHGYYIHVGLLFDYLRRIKMPVIWTLHDCWAFTGHCAHYDYQGCDKWKKGCYHCALKGDYPKSLFIDRSTKNYQLKRKIFTAVDDLTLVTPSEWLKKQLQESYLNKYPVEVIHNGIDIDVFKPVLGDFRCRFGLEGKFLILGVASIWNERKGLQYFIELEKKLKQGEKILLVGLSESQMKQLPDGIIGVQRTNSVAELAEIYSAADVFLNPTLEDNYPTTNLEAMACGVPVVTFNSGGSPECLKQGNGIVVDRGDLDGLINAISVIKHNTKSFYVEGCRKHALSFFDKDERFEEYLDLYQRIIGR